MNKAVTKILQSSVVIQTVLGGPTTYPPVTSLFIVYMFQPIPLRKLAESRQSYCNENMVQFFLAHSTYIAL